MIIPCVTFNNHSYSQLASLSFIQPVNQSINPSTAKQERKGSIEPIEMMEHFSCCRKRRRGVGHQQHPQAPPPSDKLEPRETLTRPTSTCQPLCQKHTDKPNIEVIICTPTAFRSSTVCCSRRFHLSLANRLHTIRR